MKEAASKTDGLHRHFGLLHATALNVTMIVGAGVFITIPPMLGKLPGPYALLGWLVGGALMIVDGLVWSELAATLPGSGGSYVYLLESYGRQRWGRLMAFLFIWQFLISGPLEVASGLIAIAQFSSEVDPWFKQFNAEHKTQLILGIWNEEQLALTLEPARYLAFGLGVLILFLLYRRITILGRLTVTIWLGVLGIIAWILLEGFLRFDPAVAFAAPTAAEMGQTDFVTGIGGAMVLAMYSYFGYYNVCYVGDEVRNPARTIPRAILLSSVLVCVLFVGVHLALLGTVSWRDVPPDTPNLPARFMQTVHGQWAATLVTLLLVWSCFGSVFAALFGYSRIPYGAARQGHFFSALARVHPDHRIPHVSLLLVGGLTLLWSFFELQVVIDALIVTRILEQFIGQIVGLMLLRRLQPERPRPFRMWLYPLPALLALAGWLYMYVTSKPPFIILGLATLVAGTAVFLLWSARARRWPFGAG